MLVQLAGASTAFLDAARGHLGPTRALHLVNGTSTDLPAIHADLVAQIRCHMDLHQLELNPGFATSEMWGESFEGCVPGYGSAFAAGLGLHSRPGALPDFCAAPD